VQIQPLSPGGYRAGVSEPVAPSASSASHSLTLDRGLRVLRVLAEHPDGLSVSELAGALGTHRAGIYRLLGPLVEQRLVRRTDDGRHLLGMGLVELASRVRPRLQEVAVPQLRILADELRATTALTVRDGHEAVVAAVIEPRSTDMHIAYRTGLRHRLDQAASGMAILAGGEPREGERPEITEARARGWARSAGELLPGTTGVAAPIGDEGHDAEASISAVWIEPRDEAVVGERLVAAARSIAAALRM
jgi:DNA-binding IclR family transcriptional regulator